MGAGSFGDYSIRGGGRDVNYDDTDWTDERGLFTVKSSLICVHPSYPRTSVVPVFDACPHVAGGKPGTEPGTDGFGADTIGRYNMKKAVLACVQALVASVLTVFLSCATTGSGSGVSLAEAIEQSAEKIAADLPAGSRVAIVTWESPSVGLSDYIMEELTGALVDRGMEVADRQSLEYVYKELNLQMSGNVSDESARSIGKFLGADLVITGQLTELGGPYRYRASAIHVEKATRDSVTRLDVRGDAETQRLVTALAARKPAAKADSYGESGTSAPKTAGAFLDRGIALASQGEYESAIVDYTQAIRLDPNYALAYYNRGVAYHNKGDYDRAIADYTQAIRLDPNYALAYNSRGNAYYNKEDYDRAIADYTQVIRLDPNYALAYYSRGNAYYNKEDYDRAIADYTQVIRLDPNYTFAYYSRGNAYYN
ncbi:MAG: tetratricopeptide repeat protein, partial [Treponema sp.]|nr:tetratricopeptide repeat protein [Treponema sp.]